MKSYMESGGGIDSRIINRHQVKVTGQLHATAVLHPRKKRWLGEPIWTLWRKTKIACPCRESNPDPSDVPALVVC
jgi:hypothetical protein